MFLYRQKVVALIIFIATVFSTALYIYVSISDPRTSVKLPTYAYGLSHHIPMQTCMGIQIDDYQALRTLFFKTNYQWMTIRENLTKSGSKDENEPLKTVNEEHNMKLEKLSACLEISENKRKLELNEISQYVQNRIRDLMNPSNCSTARTVHCGLINDCGFGCEFHFIVNCMQLAFHTNRTIILHSKNWRFSKQGWEFAFLPVGKCVDNGDITDLPILAGKNTAEDLDSYQIIARSNNRHDFNLPQFNDFTIPESLAEKLNRLQEDPFVWYLGQIVGYLMRPNERMEKKLEEEQRRIGFKKPIAGIQVRRGDKIGREADLHSVDEYMFYIEQWFERMEATERIVYLATDGAAVLKELKEKYPQYTFIGYNLAMEQSGIPNRNSEKGLESVIIDLHLLSRCDYLVCTGSSNICRAAYELMSYKQTDASMLFQTVDMPYHYRRTNKPLRVIADHLPITDGEIELKIGDLVIENSNYHTRPTGYSIGTNQRTKKKGKFPLFKVKFEPKTHKYKIFQN